MTTMSQVRAAARRKFGKGAYIETRCNAPTPVERQMANEKRTALIARIKELDESIKHEESDEAHLKEICEAARFVTDTDGDKTAVEKLYEKLRWCELYLDWKAERRDAIKERDSLTGKAYGHKYRVCNISRLIPGFPINEILSEADTLDELLQRVQAKETASAI